MKELKAVALKYPENAEAPFISAVGKGLAAEKILEIAQMAKDNATTSSQYPPTYQSIFALGYLLKGDGEAAFKAIQSYVDGGYSISTATGNLYALCAACVGDDESYDKIADLFANYSMELDSNVIKYKKESSQSSRSLPMSEVIYDEHSLCNNALHHFSRRSRQSNVGTPCLPRMRRAG